MRAAELLVVEGATAAERELYAAKVRQAEIELVLEISDPPRCRDLLLLPSVLLLEKMGLAARHLLQALQSKKQAC